MTHPIQPNFDLYFKEAIYSRVHRIPHKEDNIYDTLRHNKTKNALVSRTCHMYDTERLDNKKYIKTYYDNRDKYIDIPGSDPDIFDKKVEDYMVNLEKDLFEKVLSDKSWTFNNVENSVRFYVFFSDNINIRLVSMLDAWRIKYEGPAKEWTGFTNDGQNVHTKVVANQMNDGLEILKTFEVPAGQKTVDEIATAFVNELRLGGNQITTVYKDMVKWGKVSEIFAKDDYLYRRVLRGLWAKIKTYSGDLRKELIQRLWEECSEAEGLCATGHIGRLTNVLVGFDEAFKPQISFKEAFQNAMAHISQLDVAEDEKIRLATKAMDDMDVPMEERQVWLEAF